MKNKVYLKKYILNSSLIIAIFLGLFMLIQNIEYQKYKQNFNYKLNAMIEVMKKENPNLDINEIVRLFNNNTSTVSLLKEYGYDINKDSYIVQNDKLHLYFSIAKIGAFIICIFILILLLKKYVSREDKELDNILKMIEDINQKKYDLQLDELSEDKYSILNQEIYKTTIMLKEQADNSLKDKINLKNALQDISHQLKTPLTSIRILLDNMIDEPNMDEKTRNRFIKQIKRETVNISFLVQSILTLSKFESNTISFIRNDNNINKIVTAAIKNVSSLCDLKNIKVTMTNHIKNTLYCDFHWQVEAITNILKNAIEYSENNGEISIVCDENNVYFQIKIKDFGIGMDKEDVDNIFKRFYKGKNSSDDSIGIGLSLSKVIIEEDNGKAEVYSQKGNGTTFVIKYFKI